MAVMTTDEDCDELEYLGCSFLEDLLPSIKTYTLCSESQFLNLINSQTSHSTTILDIPHELLLFRTSEDTDIYTLKTILNLENPDISTYISSIDLSGRLLLSKMPSVSHGSVGGVFHDIILSSILPMDLKHALKTYIGSRIWGAQEKRAKEPDYGWGPKRRAPGQPDRPTIALEFAYSKADKKLQSDVRFWLSPRDGNANSCLTVRILQSNIRVEQWHHDNRGRLCRKGVVWITKTTDRLVVDNNYPTRISFEDLFNRRADCPRVSDIEVPQDDLRELTRAVWDDYCV
ncbi:hypothetical protein VI817_008956 [Penicillium citrinum]|nr:hypothetical protein VI817_008956 [Penicillium citrinum]